MERTVSRYVIYEVTYPDNRREGSEPLLAYFWSHSSAVSFAQHNKGKWRRKLCSTSDMLKLKYANKIGP